MTAPANSAPGSVQRYFEVSLYLLVTVGFLALASTGRLDLFSLLAVSAALIGKALRYHRGREPELSAQTVTTLTWFYFVFYLLDYFLLSGAFLEATTHLVLFIAVVKLYSARTNRDYFWLALVAFMEILAAATLTVDTTFLVFFFLFLIVGISTFISFEIKRGAEVARSAPLPAGSPLGRRLERSLLLTSLSVAMATLALGGLLFFILPRFTTGYMSAYAFQPEQISGFTNEVSLGDIGSIKLNSEVVMRVRVEEGDPQQLDGLKWRGLALTRFDGHHWYSTERPPRVFHSPRGRFELTEAPLRDQPRHAALPHRLLHYRVLLEPISAEVLFAAAVPLEIDGRFRVLGVDDTDSLSYLRPGFGQVGYDVVSDVGASPPALLRAASRDYPPSVREDYLQLPPVDPRVAELARRIAAPFDNPYDIASALTSYLRTRYGYTLELPAQPEADPIAHFLLVRKRGHCEYFAASLAVMLRTLGIPARVVNGFLTGEFNDVGGSYIVRARDAHTWVEVYFPGVGWVEFDPTPPDPNPPPRTWLTTAQHYLDAFELWWDEWVINYDEFHQFQLARNLRESFYQARLARYWLHQKRRQLSQLVSQTSANLLHSRYALPAGVLLALLVLLIVQGHRLREAVRLGWLLRRARRHALGAAEATLLYHRLLAALQRRGYRRRPGETPLEFAASLPPPELATAVGEFTRLYNRTRFGAEPAAGARLLQLLQHVRAWKPGAAS